jgi:hypothetical protein
VLSRRQKELSQLFFYFFQNEPEKRYIFAQKVRIFPFFCVENFRQNSKKLGICGGGASGKKIKKYWKTTNKRESCWARKKSCPSSDLEALCCGTYIL